MKISSSYVVPLVSFGELNEGFCYFTIFLIHLYKREGAYF